MNSLRLTLLETLGQVQEIVPIINKLQFGAMAYVYGVYQLESLRMTVDSSMIQNIFCYLEDRAVQKDKNGEMGFLD